MRSIIFLSMDNLTGWVSDDELLIKPFQSAGWKVETISWHAPEVDWSRYDAVVLRTTWDYQANVPEFLAKLAEIEAAGTPLANPRTIVEWNYDKRYLFELAAKGIEIVPSVLLEPPLSAASIEAARTEFGDRGVVIKPTVGATASDTFRLLANSKSDSFPAEMFETFAQKPCILQPFMPSVVDEGEFSLHFFGGKLSHTILKSPASGDYRVQEEWGGTPEAVEPEPALVEAAKATLAAIPGSVLYARIDMVRTESGGFALMEAELIEPALYFRTDPDSPERFVQAFIQWMG